MEEALTCGPVVKIGQKAAMQMQIQMGAEDVQ